MGSLEQSIEDLKNAMEGKMRLEIETVEQRVDRRMDKTDQILEMLVKGQEKLFKKMDRSGPDIRPVEETGQEDIENSWGRRRSVGRFEDDSRHDGRSNWRKRKLEIPNFNGEDPDSWVRKAEKYFSFYQLNEKEKLEAVAVCFEGEAEMWLDWEEQNGTIRSWHDLKKLILGRFRPWDENEMCEYWMSAEQTGTVAEYRSDFVSRLTHLGKKEESVMVGAFMRGLREEIKAELKMLGPVNLGQTMAWAEK